ncbi:tripartite tricarboxylate transporter permease [Geminicoccaceae bacterium 1502E]|nr:tripartite tricarboxylate transporter permease [Geminicoccaceae bacterium 1502E]
MSSLELLFNGLGLLVTDPVALALFFGGLCAGSLFGAIPGINMLTLGAVLLPFSAQMNPAHAIMLYSVIYCSGVFGGAITAILFNIPGAPENAATAIDGYPLTRAGKSRKAVGAAVLCSALGGVISSLVMIFAAQATARWAVQAIQPADIFGIVALGIAIAATVGAKTIWKGWLSVLFGMLLACVGTDPIDSAPRFTFGSYALYAGIKTVPLILGVFAVVEIFSQLASRGTLPAVRSGGGSEHFSLSDLLQSRWTVCRSTVIGFFAGLVPGVGASLAAFVSYGSEKALAGRSGRFGRGELRGVIAAETANNAATGAAMIPMLALGLPGGALTAMMIGVYQLHGMEPGPLIFTTAPDIISLVFAAMLLANVGILLLGWVEARTVTHLVRLDTRYLMIFLLVISTIGAYAERNLMIDVWVMFGAGVMAWFLRESGYSMAGLVLGLILGRVGEASFMKAALLADYDVLAFFERPVAAVCLGLAVAVTCAGVLVDMLKRAGPATARA